MLQVINLNAGYGKFQILFDVNLKVDRNSLTVIIGPNGSGKSTLLKSIAGLTKIYSGRVMYDGREISGLKPHIIASLGIAYLPQIGNVFQGLTVEENLRMAGYLLSDSEYREGLSEALRIFPQIRDWLKKPVWWLSGGERQMLAISMAIVRRSKLMLMDEPTAALAPKLATQILNRIRYIVDELGVTVVLVEQNAVKALRTCDQAYLLVAGRVAHQAACSEMLKDPELSNKYLGIKTAM